MLLFPQHFPPQERYIVFLEQPNFLNPAEVAHLTALAREITFIEGRVTNPHNTTKLNQQADLNDARNNEASAIVGSAFARAPPCQDFAMPAKVAAPLLARYENGMRYGAHADIAYMSPIVDGVI